MFEEDYCFTCGRLLFSQAEMLGGAGGWGALAMAVERVQWELRESAIERGLSRAEYAAELEGLPVAA